MLVTRTDGGWELRPTRARFLGGLKTSAGMLVVFAAFACLLLRGLLTQGFEGSFDRFCAMLCFAFALLMALYCVVRGFQYCLFRGARLLIEDSGRISYRGREVCGAGTVRAVAVVTYAGDQETTYKVKLELTDRQVAELPSPYFDEHGLSTSDRDQVDSLAEKFARALGVEIVNRTEYGGGS